MARVSQAPGRSQERGELPGEPGTPWGRGLWEGPEFREWVPDGRAACEASWGLQFFLKCSDLTFYTCFPLVS